MGRLAHACREFGLTISLKKTEVMSQGTGSHPSIHIRDYNLNLVSQFQYLGSTIASNLSLEPEISARIAKAAETMSKLQKRVWDNKNLTNNTKMQVYRAGVLSTLLYSSEAWTTYATQEERLNSFHLRCLRHILGIRGQDLVPNTEVLERAGLPSIFALLAQCRLRYKDSCKRDLKSAGIDLDTWESLAENRGAWRSAVLSGVERAEEEGTTCSIDCHSRIRLYSHQRKCSTRT